MQRHDHIALLILDGWGIGTDPKADAIQQAHTPNYDRLLQESPHARLVTYGEDVGLPEGQMGNSEVGHLNIGAGRVVYQELARINKAVRDGSLSTNTVLREAIAYAKENNTKLHLLGLLSNGGVHSHINHLLALIDILDEAEVERVFVHAFTDGRDVDPKSGKDFVRQLLNHTKQRSARLASVIGRYYAMDRDNRWERIKLAYDLLVESKGETTADVLQTIQRRYDDDETDEFLKPIVCTPDGTIEANDVVLFFNFRTDRPRELTTVPSQMDFPEHQMRKRPLYFVTMTRYDDNFENVRVMFTKADLKNTLGEVLSDHRKTQLRIAETEKYPHVTFFFSGGREDAFDGEDRILIPSPKVATYDLQPEMSAREITAAIIEKIEAEHPHFICLNYANTDMVGHTGDFKAAIRAAETVDDCLSQLLDALNRHNYLTFIIADHGNSDYMINADGTPNTAHTKNPVPVILTGPGSETFSLRDGKLADLAPTILKLMQLPIPDEMDGKLLI